MHQSTLTNYHFCSDVDGDLRHLSPPVTFATGVHAIQQPCGGCCMACTPEHCYNSVLHRACVVGSNHVQCMNRSYVLYILLVTFSWMALDRIVSRIICQAQIPRLHYSARGENLHNQAPAAVPPPRFRNFRPRFRDSRRTETARYVSAGNLVLRKHL